MLARFQRTIRPGRFTAVAAGPWIWLFGCQTAMPPPDPQGSRYRPVLPLSTPEQMVQRYRPHYASVGEIASLNAGCLSCHRAADGPFRTQTMHASEAVLVSCIDCHGGDAGVRWDGAPVSASDAAAASPAYVEVKEAAHHARPRYPKLWNDPATGRLSAANPVRSNALLNFEDPEWIRFVNPGDLRVAHATCGQCHMEIVQRVRNSMMTHGAQLWQAVLYNNGSYPEKTARFGESYSVRGVPQRLYSVRRPPEAELAAGAPGFLKRHTPTPQEKARGALVSLDPLPRWEITQMGNILRAFERGGKEQRLELELGLPNVFSEPGKPDMKLSDRGLGTQLETDPVFLGIQKTRLLDPILSFFGTNDHPGDYRSSGCTSCHAVYANDRSPVHSGPFAACGNDGSSRMDDPTIARQQPGHPIEHVMTRGIPSSQCVVCHVHPGTSYANTYLGFMWWDNETHGELMYPRQQRYPTDEQVYAVSIANPEGSAVRGLWSGIWPDQVSHAGQTAGPKFLEHLYTDINPQMDKTQFADFHGHGWVFKAVFKQDRKGRFLDASGAVVDPATPAKLQEAVAFRAAQRGQTPPPGVPVHLKDIHLERGMHCIDCHFEQDVHGDGMLYGEVRNAIEVDCVDCHGTIQERATLVTSGPNGGNNLISPRYNVTINGPRFVWRGQRLVQKSAVEKGVEWEVPQIRDAVDRDSPHYNPKAAYAKLLRRDGGWDDPRCPEADLAHANSRTTCYACHTSWMTSCFGCHLPMRANERRPMLHNEALITRNYTQYNYQVVRDDVFMLGIDSLVKGGRIAPVRSSSAVVVGSQNANREWSYSQQQTISTEGFSGQAFNPHFPHAVRKTETRGCSDCHVSERNDNNAWLAQVLLQGTNLTSFLGRFVYVALGHGGFEAVVVTERDEPQAVIGSTLHELAYPDDFARHQAGGGTLREAYEHQMNDGLLPTGGEILDCQLRGEYLYTARGEAGFYAYDVANIDNKGFSERIVSAPVSPLGQSLSVRTKYATAVASPTTLGVDPTRTRLSSNPLAPRATGLDPPQPYHVNHEQPVSPVYAFLYVSDLYEGLVVIGDRKAGVGTLLDGEPRNNFLKKALSFNPDGRLNGAVNLTIAGDYAYVCCARGLAVVDISNPLEPRIVAEIGAPQIVRPAAAAVQFRYAFICDAEGLKVVEVTDPTRPRPLPGASVGIEDARRLYLARTYAYVAAGAQGLVIVDIERPEQPAIDQVFTADGQINDARDVKVGMTNASAFAYVADGRNGLRVVQLTSPGHTPGFQGFSPRPTPRLIATYPTPEPALAVSEGLDRDRAVDESGHQLAVFARIGARPMNLEEQQRMYLRDGQVFTVSDEPAEAVRSVASRKE
jgi:hypothetical protein